jgi:hypothetical protein
MNHAFPPLRQIADLGFLTGSCGAPSAFAFAFCRLQFLTMLLVVPTVLGLSSFRVLLAPKLVGGIDPVTVALAIGALAFQVRLVVLLTPRTFMSPSAFGVLSILLAASGILAFDTVTPATKGARRDKAVTGWAETLPFAILTETVTALCDMKRRMLTARQRDQIGDHIVQGIAVHVMNDEASRYLPIGLLPQPPVIESSVPSRVLRPEDVFIAVSDPSFHYAGSSRVAKSTPNSDIVPYEEGIRE